MQEWIMSANAEIYNHALSFEHFGYIDWRQGLVKFNLNDIVYIYCTRPTSSIEYKCKITKINLNHSEIRDDKDYWKNTDEYLKSLNGKFMRLELISYVSNYNLNLDFLKKNGLKAAPQGPIKVVEELSNYLKKIFDINNQIEFFPDLLNVNENHFEGLKTRVTVNKYERSAIARKKCVDFHGVNCSICNINFFDTYGVIGKDFIHVHHLYPLHQVGMKYKVDFEKDLIPVCPNCHSMLHRKINGKEPSIEELKKMIKKQT